ncbi:penicillin acylase family protein [Seonamhaeicola maritimus]|uniref:Penicillin acylase family protein n=1 Tax=Seonamhaeicola maritimus TaxID=2591822 RepID=A0A5C7GI36_9FLAO|nr:penicillin acylase family protein [Seonamhaeicola maritimus]TXG37089.1 penicillin acylase family protein [Seonamhaeicola maritimus]
MKFLKLILSASLVVAVFYGLNNQIGSAPPIGKFLNPTSGIWQNEKDDFDVTDVQIEGLTDKVTVHYDEHLIPHIFAQNDKDLYRAQGYVTAKHRLWQMEFQTHASAGRISEIIGEKGLTYDRSQRRKGMGYGADVLVKKWGANLETKKLIEAFSEGVNSFINNLNSKDLPVEYKLLDYKPELWSTKKTAFLLMFMTDMLCGGDSDLEYTNALRELGKERFDFLYPDFFDFHDPVIPRETDWSFINKKTTETPKSELPLDSITETMEKPNPHNGSNNWAVGPKKSYSGNPILANDPHLGLNLPSIWYVMQLATPEHNSFGATLPGALGIISGFNNHIAWGETNATRDVKDWYKIEFQDKSRAKYKYGDGWKNTSVRVEEIKIKGKESYLDSVIYTHHGPVSYDHTFKGKGEKIGYAMKWIGHMAKADSYIFLDLNKGKNYNDYLNAIKNWVAPAQNFVFASTEGDIALWVQGQFPNKWKEQGKFLLDGSNPDHDWQSFIPQEYNAHTKNPERGFVSSSNQFPTDSAYPFFVFNDGYDTYRNRVINDYFRAKDKYNIQDFKKLQNTNFNKKASDLLPYMLKNMDASTLNTEEKGLLNIIKSWDFNSETDMIAPSIWDAWWTNLNRIIWDEYKRSDVALVTPFVYQTIHLLKNNPDDSAMDILQTPEKENAHDLFLISFKQAAKELQDWKSKNGDYAWSKYKGTYVKHLLQGLPAFSRHNIPIGGDKNTVNAAGKNWGPSWRMIVEMSSPPKAIGIYPGGQSGNPGSKYYDNFIDDWAAGKYLDLNFMQDQNNTDGIVATQNLTL